MNNNLKLVIVAAISFAIGVVATNSFNTDRVLSPRQRELQKIAIVAERTPFFPAASPVGKEVSIPKVDYYTFRKQLYNFQDTIRRETTQKFAEGNLKDESSEGRRNILNSKVSQYFKDKDPWFKATLNLDKDNKIVIYYNFLTSKPLDQVQKSENVSFTAYLYIYNNGKWSSDLVPTGLSQLLWNNDEPYFPINLSHNMEGFARTTDYLLVIIPVPSGSGVLHFLKYQDSKLTWELGPKVNWTLSSKEEAWAFQRETYKAIEWTPYYLQP